MQEQNVKIKYKTEYVIDSTKSDNYEKVTTEGKIGEGVATNRVVYVDGNQISSETKGSQSCQVTQKRQIRDVCIRKLQAGQIG